MIYTQELIKLLKLPANQFEEAEQIAIETEALWISETQTDWEEVQGKVEIIRNRDFKTKLYPTLTPLTTLTQVRVKNQFNGSWLLLVENTDYGVLGNLIERINSNWESLIELTYTGGYTLATLPEDIKRALKQQALFIAKHLRENITTQSQNFEGGAGVFHKPDFHPFFAATVKKYRKHIVG